MSAKIKTFFELKKVVDHDCGNYRIGEIDYVDYNAIIQYINDYGDFGEQEINRVCIKILAIVQQTAIVRRNRDNEQRATSFK